MTKKSTIDLKWLSRKDIRYVLFRKRLELLEGTPDSPKLAPTSDVANAIYEYYQKQPGFTGFDQFETHWDIGIDDMTTMLSRPGKWWLFGISKLRIVTRLSHHTETIDDAMYHLSRNGFIDNPTQYESAAYAVSRADYVKILELVEIRKTW